MDDNDNERNLSDGESVLIELETFESSEDKKETISNDDFIRNLDKESSNSIDIDPIDNTNFVEEDDNAKPAPFIRSGTSILSDKPLTNVDIHQRLSKKPVTLASKYPPEELIPFLVKLARSYYVFGAPANRVENNLARCSEKMGIYASYQCLPSNISVTFGAPEMLGSITKSIRVPSPTIDCGRLYQIDHLIDRISSQEDYTLNQAKEKLDKIIKRKPYFNRVAKVSCVALNAGCAAGLFFGGGWLEIVISFFIGLGLALFRLFIERFKRFSPRIVDFICALITSCIATILSHHISGLCYLTITLSSIVSLLPGVSLTIAIREIEMDCIATGTIRFINACLIAFKLGFGIAIGSYLPIWVTEKPSMIPCTNSLSQWWYFLFFPLISITFNVSLDSKVKQWIGMSATAFVGFMTSYICNIIKVPAEIIPSIAAFFVATLANLISRYSTIPGVIFIFPGILFLVPGSIAVRSILNFFSNDSLAGIQIGFSMIMVALSITIGTIVANIFVAPKKNHKNRVF